MPPIIKLKSNDSSTMLFLIKVKYLFGPKMPVSENAKTFTTQYLSILRFATDMYTEAITDGTNNIQPTFLNLFGNKKCVFIKNIYLIV
jgi:hypothetical protein